MTDSAQDRLARMSTEDDAFDNAQFYTCRDVDRLTCTTPDEAIEEHLDESYERGVGIAEQIDKLCPITVTAWNQCEVSANEIETLASSLVDDVVEWLAENCGGPEYKAELLETDKWQGIMPAMKAAVEKVVAYASWNGCEETAERDYDADQVTAMMREQNPEWFKTSERG